MTVIGESPRAGRMTQQRTLRDIMQKKLAAKLRQRTMSRLAGTSRGTSRVRGQHGRRFFGPGAKPGVSLDVLQGKGFGANPRAYYEAEAPDVNTAPLPAPLPEGSARSEDFVTQSSSLGTPNPNEVAAAYNQGSDYANQIAPGVLNQAVGDPGSFDYSQFGYVPLGGGVWFDPSTGKVFGMGGNAGNSTYDSPVGGGSRIPV